MSDEQIVVTEEDVGVLEVTPKSKIVEAVGLAVSTRGRNAGSKAQMIEEAMRRAIITAHEEGITAPEEIRNRMMNARDLVLNKIR